MIEPEYLAEVLGATCDIALVVNAEGVVASLLTDTMPSGETVSHWANQPLDQVLTPESVEKFKSVLDLFLAGGAMPRNVELNHKDGGNAQFPIRYSTYRVSSEELFLMMGQDLRHVAASQQQLVQAQIALERGMEERRDVDARYRLLLSTTRDAFLVLSADDETVLDANLAAAHVLGVTRDGLLGRRLPDILQPASDDHVSSSARAAGLDGQSVLYMLSDSGQQAWLTRVPFRAAGEAMTLCRLDPNDVDETRASDRLGAELTALFRASTDAIAFTDVEGVILSANESFLEMLRLGHAGDLVGRSLVNHLARGKMDMQALRDTSMQSGRIRFYTTWITDDFGGRLPAEISVTYLPDGPAPRLAFVVRDASYAGVLRPQSQENSTEATASKAASLVGQASLKEIVAATSDVIEKMCIETAIELTRNNRAAAAELLNLSRQSLYIKLRKHGLIESSSSDTE